MFSRLNHREPLSNVDAAWLKMEDPTNLMMITGIMLFDVPIDFDHLQRLIGRRILGRFKRFRQRVAKSRRPGRVYWELDPHFDLTHHLDRIILPSESDEAMLQGLVDTLMSTPLDYRRPLWQIHLVENYGRGCALLFRLHHCIADGIALIQVLLSLTDERPDAPEPEWAAEGHERPFPLESLFRPFVSRTQKTMRVVRTLRRGARTAFADPSQMTDWLKLGVDGAAALGRLALRSPDPKTVFKGPLDIAKRAVWSDAVPLATVKAIGQSLGGTVNDVLLTAMTGSLRQYLRHQGQAVDGVNFRAAVPVNLRSPESGLELGNQFGLVFLSLPVGLANPVERLFELRRRMARLKASSEALVVLGVLNAIGLTPKQVEGVFVDLFGAKATCVMTNVPGPRRILYLAGRPIRSMMFWVPQSGRLGMGISIMSYAGEVRMGVATDAGLVPDPETILAGFHLEFEALQALVK